MVEIDALQLTPSELEPMLRVWAQGVQSLEAANELIINHGTWLARADFRRECVTAVDQGMHRGQHVPMAAISWQRAARFLETAPASRSESNVLRLACSLAGVDTGALGKLTEGLDPVNTARVLDALAHRAGWHERGMHHTVDGRQDRVLHDRTPGLTC